ncbi:MAG: hypothetical protein WCA79_09915 [Anaerolineales bacterium]
MKTLARITAVILIIFGILVMLGGLTMGVIGIVRAGSRALGAAPLQPALRAAGGGLFGGLGGLILVIFIVIQGLMIIATGEGLFLLANLSEKMIPPSA